MNPFEMVLGIIIVVTIGRVLQARYGIRRDRHGSHLPPAETSQENAMLREEVKSLKERISVLERLATDNNRALDLDREIERLR